MTTLIKVSGLEVSSMVKESKLLRVLNMTPLFKKMSLFLLELNIKADQYIKVILKIEKSMERVNIYGQMGTYTKVTLIMVLLKEMATSNTLVEIFITDR